MNKQVKEPSETIALYVEQRRGFDNELRIEVRICTIGTRDDGDLYPRTPEDVGGLFLANGELGFYAFANMLGDSAPRMLVGDLEYHDAAFVDFYKADRIVKTLAKLEKAMSKLSATLGHSGAVGETMARLALVVKADRVFVKTLASKSWRLGDVSTARFAIETWEREERESKRAA